MLTFVLLSPAHATTWTVDGSGYGDATTIADGVALLADGDTLSIAAGTYDVMHITVLANDVLIEGVGWESTSFDGSAGEHTTDSHGMEIRGENVLIEGISFRNYIGLTAETAVYVSGSATFQGCAFIGNQVGAHTEFYDASDLSVFDTIFAQNYIGIYAPNDLNGLRVENSIFLDNDRSVWFYGDYDSAKFNLISIVNNTFVDGFAGVAISPGYGYPDEFEYQVYIVNNIFAGMQHGWSLGEYPYFTPTGQISNNVYSSGADSTNAYATILEADNLEAEPEFVAWSDDGDWTNDDLHLVAGSPGIDAGVNGYGTSTTDFDGVERSLDGDGDAVALPDAGAYEYCPPELCVEADTGGDTGADTGFTTDTGDSSGADTSADSDEPSDTGGGVISHSLFGCSVAGNNTRVSGLALALLALIGLWRPRA